MVILGAEIFGRVFAPEAGPAADVRATATSSASAAQPPDAVLDREALTALTIGAAGAFSCGLPPADGRAYPVMRPRFRIVADYVRLPHGPDGPLRRLPSS
jgi:hypothetical protein